MIKIAICDNNSICRNQVKQLCEAHFRAFEIEYELKEYESGEAFLLADYPDIVFLDITMGKVSGFIVREILVKANAKTRIVFLADNCSFMQEAYGKNVYGYLVKPVNRETLYKKLPELLEDVKKQNQRISFYCNGEIQVLDKNQVVCLEAHGRYTSIYTSGGACFEQTFHSLEWWQKQLSSHLYVKLGKRFMLDISFVEGLKQEDDLKLIVCTKGNWCFVVEKGYRKEFMESYLSYCSRGKPSVCEVMERYIK